MFNVDDDYWSWYENKVRILGRWGFPVVHEQYVFVLKRFTLPPVIHRSKFDHSPLVQFPLHTSHPSELPGSLTRDNMASDDICHFGGGN